MKKKVSQVILKGVVPWQICPICKGEGRIFERYFNKEEGMKGEWNVCDVCGGEKIIPMALTGEDEGEDELEKMILN